MSSVSEKKKKSSEKIRKAEEKGKGVVIQPDQDEYMLAQIDRFRNRAKELQEKLRSREEELARLEADIEEKDRRVQELEILVNARREENDNFLESADRQFRDMVYRLEGRINVLAREIEEKVASDEKLSEDQTVKLQWEIKQIDRSLDKVKSDLSDKTHQEMLTTYRNMHTALEETEARLDEALESVKQAAEAAKVDEKTVRRIRRPAVAAMVFSLLSLAGVIGCLMIESGLITFTFL